MRPLATGFSAGAGQEVEHPPVAHERDQRAPEHEPVEPGQDSRDNGLEARHELVHGVLLGLERGDAVLTPRTTRLPAPPFGAPQRGSGPQGGPESCPSPCPCPCPTPPTSEVR